MTCIISEELRYARTKFLLELAEQGGGKVLPDVFLKAVNGSQKLILNILWIARRSGYVSVDQVREGRKIAYWDIKVTGKIPSAPAIQVSPLDAKKGVKTKQPKAAKPVKAKSASAAKDIVKVEKAPKVKAEKTVEKIKAANLAKMKKVSAKLAAAKKKSKKVIDFVEKELGSTGEIASSFSIDNGWDSMDGINPADFLR
jgi:phage-related protein